MDNTLPKETQRRFVQFSGPRLAEICFEPLGELQPNQVRVQTICSAISAGTELLVYRGELPESMALDTNIQSLSEQKNSWPIRYGYASVGVVTESGDDVGSKWVGERVFAFQPHQSHFCAIPETLIPLPEGMAAEDGVFLPNMETAVSFVMDGRPLLGETVIVLGLGVVGQLTLKLLAGLSPGRLIGVDQLSSRREAGLKSGATAVFDPADPNLKQYLGDLGADLLFELSGNPQAIDLAVQLAGYSSRIVIGSWYGKKQATVDFGGHFHRSNIQLIASQVSRLHPSLTGRWTKQRRMNVAVQMLAKHRPSRTLITHRPDVSEATQIYKMLDERPEEALQVVFNY